MLASRFRASGATVPVPPVPGGRDHQDQDAQHDLHPASEPSRIDHRDQVMRDEPATIAGLTGPVPQVLLQIGQRAGEAGELDQRPLHQRRKVRPDDPLPAPGKENAPHNEADEQQVHDNHGISGDPVPHHVTTRPADPFPA